MNSLTEQQRTFLARFGFDPQLQQKWQEDLAAGRLGPDGNAVEDPLLPPPPGSVHKLPGATSSAHRELEQVGRTTIERGELGVVLLNGGMATRFCGVVKGTMPVVGRRSFLSLAFEDVLRHGDGKVPVFLMNSFATDTATRAHLDRHDYFGADPALIEHFTQFIALRMTPRGELFRTADGEPSPYGPGHGDFPRAFRESGALRRFVERGGRYLLVRNVDNLGARIDPVLLGHHVRSGCEVSVEVAPKWPEDVGGSPFQYRGRTQLIEQLRYPPGFDASIVDVFNTNTFTFTAAALDRDFELGWYYVDKQVDGRPAVQMEHLIGELTAHLETDYVQVRRSGPQSRFLPVKTPEDLQAAHDEIVEMYDGVADGDS